MCWTLTAPGSSSRNCAASRAPSPAQAAPPQPPEVMALAGRYGLQFGQPDWLPELIGRYHLTPPPGG